MKNCIYSEMSGSVLQIEGKKITQAVDTQQLHYK